MIGCIYGKRGITVCDRWRESVTNFLEDMGHPPEGLELGRIDNDGNYEPGNCRWVTCKENANNRPTSVFLVHEGVRLTVSQWARRLDMNVQTVFSRLRGGWSIARIVNTPVVPYRRP